MELDINQPHDSFFRAVFSNPERAADLLRAGLPKDLAAEIDWQHLTPQPESFVDPELRNQYADLVFQTKRRGSTTLLYVLVEHKSASDRWLPLQLLRYIVRLWDDWLRKHPRSKHLPPVVPFVLHHGKRPWRGPRSLRDLLALQGAPQALVAVQPNLEFPILDLATLDRAALQALGTGDQTLLMLLALRYLPHVPSAGAQLLSMEDLFSRVANRESEGTRQLIQLLLYYALVVSQGDPEELRDAVSKIQPNTEEFVMTAAHKLIERGRQEASREFKSAAHKLIEQGRQEGEAAGMHEGQLQGQRQALSAVLTARFGTLPPDLAQLAQQAPAADLPRLIERAVKAASLADVFA